MTIVWVRILFHHGLLACGNLKTHSNAASGARLTITGILQYYQIEFQDRVIALQESIEYDGMQFVEVCMVICISLGLVTAHQHQGLYNQYFCQQRKLSWIYYQIFQPPTLLSTHQKK